MYYAKSPEELPSRETMLSMSGLEFMLAMARKEIPRSPISSVMDYDLHHVEAGKVIFSSVPKFQHCNPMGGVHGGWYGTLLDSCMACAVMTMVPKGSVYTTLEYKVNLTRGIPVGTEIHATGTIDHAGRSTGVASGEIRGVDDSKLYATGSTTCLIMKLL